MRSLGLFFFSLFCFLAHASKPVELILWHGMASHLGDEVRLLAEDFNRSQNEFIITPVYKGDYLETLTSFAAAFRAHRPPALVQVFEVGTAIMLSPPGLLNLWMSCCVSIIQPCRKQILFNPFVSFTVKTAA